jgi:hypothetical protein
MILKLGDFEGFQSPDSYAWFSVCSQNIEAWLEEEKNSTSRFDFIAIFG